VVRHRPFYGQSLISSVSSWSSLPSSSPPPPPRPDRQAFSSPASLAASRSETDFSRIAHELPKLNCLRPLEKDYNALLAIAQAITLKR
jgi:hypothetical protein